MWTLMPRGPASSLLLSPFLRSHFRVDGGPCKDSIPRADLDSLTHAMAARSEVLFLFLLLTFLCRPSSPAESLLCC
jgi:hypothetical protein